MDFGALSPEINSGRMYSGPGSTPMLAAASAWDALAAELSSTATTYGAVINSLTEGPWLGPASAAMTVAASPYIRWMSVTAAEAEQTADQARAAAAAYEAAFAGTVPPGIVAVNRTQLAALVATNVLGQNTAAIAATEALYGEMWAQDAAAMYGYAGSSAVASTVTPFRSPPETTNAAGAASQGGAVNQAAGASSSVGAQSALSQLVSTVPPALQSLASPVQSAALPALQPGDVTNLLSNLASSSFTPMSVAGITQVGADLSVIRALSATAVPGAGASGVAAEGVAAMGAVGPSGAASLGSAPVSAGIGRATLVGTMSVPQSWAAAAPAASPAAAASPTEGWYNPPGIEEVSGTAGAPGMPGMPMAGAPGGRGWGFAAPRYGFKPTVVGRPPAAG
ncbi:PPE family protein [Mycobacterium sp.]|uniref:PPE family protein n=1 Tax=Mycobacterium sp. TaxID=1785 RepID=UPI003D0E4F0F